jgi:hypothetical protein
MWRQGLVRQSQAGMAPCLPSPVAACRAAACQSLSTLCPHASVHDSTSASSSWPNHLCHICVLSRLPSARCRKHSASCTRVSCQPLASVACLTPAYPPSRLAAQRTLANSHTTSCTIQACIHLHDVLARRQLPAAQQHRLHPGLVRSPAGRQHRAAAVDAGRHQPQALLQRRDLPQQGAALSGASWHARSLKRDPQTLFNGGVGSGCGYLAFEKVA